MPLARILVSDDDAAIQQLYRLAFSRHGFDVIVAPEGRGTDTLELCRSELPDLIITDVNKPTLCGPELCRAIRSDPRTAHIPVLFVSAMGEQHDRQRSRAAGADDHLVKPFFIEALLYRIVALLAMAYAANFRLATLNRHVSPWATYHPVTGLPGPQQLADALPRMTRGSGWAVVTLNMLRFELLLRAYDIVVGDTLLTHLAAQLSAALERACAGECLIAHPGYDWRITLVGPAAPIAGVVQELQARFAADLRRHLRSSDVACDSMAYTDTHGQRQSCPLVALAAHTISDRAGPIPSLHALWDRLDATWA